MAEENNSYGRAPANAAVKQAARTRFRSLSLATDREAVNFSLDCETRRDGSRQRKKGLE